MQSTCDNSLDIFDFIAIAFHKFNVTILYIPLSFDSTEPVYCLKLDLCD